MPLDDLRDFLDQPTLTMPIGGTTYEVQPCSAKTWLELQDIYSAAMTKTPRLVSDVDIFRMTLGDTLDRMLDGGVSSQELRQAGMTAWFWQLGNQELAESYWHGGGKAPEPVKGKPRRRTATPTRTGAATTTRKRASRSTTTTRPTSKPNGPA